MGTLEFLRENVGKFFRYVGKRCRPVGAGKDGKVERCLYVTKDQLIPIENVSARQSAGNNAGRYYTFDEDGSGVRVVGHRSDKVIMTRGRGWHRLDREDKFTGKTKATRFRYASVCPLKEIPLC